MTTKPMTRSNEKTVVLDAGVVLKALLPEPDRIVYKNWLDAQFRNGARLVAPTLWLYETSSVLAKAVYQGRIDESTGRAALDLVHRFDIELVVPGAAQSHRAFAWARKLNRAHAYDGFYLALAEESHCAFYTTDKKLIRAVDLPWVRTP